MLRSAWESSHTLSFTAALAIHTLNTSESMHIPDLCFALYHQPWQLPSSSFTVSNTCLVELLAGGIHSMNNVVLTKWYIALSINIGVLENLKVENKLNISGYSVKLPVRVLTIKYFVSN